jgi:hypothetical protein
MIADRSFSGTHDWHPTVLLDTDAGEWEADNIVWNIERGHCPRCERPLPHLPEYPAGSRITQCRSIPICGPCGTDEAYEPMTLGYISGLNEWPLDIDEIDERRTRFEEDLRLATLVLNDSAGHQLLTEDGVSRVVNPLNTGGWAHYGGAA